MDIIIIKQSVLPSRPKVRIPSTSEKKMEKLFLFKAVPFDKTDDSITEEYLIFNNKPSFENLKKLLNLIIFILVKNSLKLII